MVRRAAIRIVSCVAVLACVASASCGSPVPDEPDYIRVVVDIDPKLDVPGDLDRFVIDVTRGDKVVDSKSYDATVMGKLPDSLVIYNSKPNNDSPETQLVSVPMLRVKLTAYRGSEARLANSFEYRFNQGQIQVGLPMCRDCLLKMDCAAGTKCKRNQCVDENEITTAADKGATVSALTDCGP
jgi:hypothetical protein